MRDCVVVNMPNADIDEGSGPDGRLLPRAAKRMLLAGCLWSTATTALRFPVRCCLARRPLCEFDGGCCPVTLIFFRGVPPVLIVALIATCQIVGRVAKAA